MRAAKPARTSTAEASGIPYVANAEEVALASVNAGALTRPYAPAERGLLRQGANIGMRTFSLILALIGLCIGVAVALRVWQGHQGRVPAGFAFGDGRLEPDEIDIDTKFAGRVAAIYVNEGDFVRAGQAVARMDTRDLDAERGTAEAQRQQAARVVDEDRALIVQQRTVVDLARTELDRYRQLRTQDFVTQEDLDQRQQAYDGATAALTASIARGLEARRALDAASHALELVDTDIADDTLYAPRDGRIEYRIADVGEVLSPEGKVLTMLDATSQSMNIFLPTADAGRVRLHGDAVIVLDADPQHPLAAVVSVLADQAEFTAKVVETKVDRDALWFQVNLRVDPGALRARERAVQTGLRGTGYVRLDSTRAWPAWLTPRPAASDLY